MAAINFLQAAFYFALLCSGWYIELTVLENDFPQAIANYHFDVQVDKNDELFFDFKLKDGICKSMNASILMKKIGIEVD